MYVRGRVFIIKFIVLFGRRRLASKLAGRESESKLSCLRIRIGRRAKQSAAQAGYTLILFPFFWGGVCLLVRAARR